MKKRRLLNVAKALRQSPDPGRFTMCTYHQCGTPACAVGHYAARRDFQEVMQIDQSSYTGGLLFGVWGATQKARHYQDFLCEHFDITAVEEEKLFSISGCGNAKTPIAAAKYIEQFVREHG